MKKAEEIINKLLDQKVNLSVFIAAFLSIIFLRVFIEQFVAKSSPLTFDQIIIEYIHNLYFFLISFLMIWIFLSLLLKINPAKLAYIFSLAAILIIFPPLIDMVKTQGQVFWSFYILSSVADLKIQFLTVFGHLPSGIVYFGTRIVFIAAIIFITGLVYFKTKNPIKALITAFAAYVILFFMGSFPSIFSYFYYPIIEKKNIGEIQAFNIAQLFGTPQKLFGITPMDFKYSFAYKLDLIYFMFLMLLFTILFYMISRQKFWAVLKNFRYPQIIFHTGLYLAGAGLAFLRYPQNLELNIFSLLTVAVLAVSVWLAWKASVVLNDVIDLKIDKISNSWRPLPKEIFSQNDYIQFGLACFLLSLLGGITVGTKFFVLLLAYQVIAWFYSAPPFRLKRFPLVATLASSLALLMVFFLGYILVSDGQTIATLQARIIFLLLITYTLSIPAKDFKDIEGDRKDGVWTVPVIFGEKKAKLIIASAIFVSFMSSVFFINEVRLFWWALIFGIFTFWVMVWGNIKPRRLPGIIISIVAIYGLILTYVVFIPSS
jgi:4-hydroxybenzoate polyprenyltransferase